MTEKPPTAISCPCLERARWIDGRSSVRPKPADWHLNVWISKMIPQ